MHGIDVPIVYKHRNPLRVFQVCGRTENWELGGLWGLYQHDPIEHADRLLIIRMGTTYPRVHAYCRAREGARETA